MHVSSSDDILNHNLPIALIEQEADPMQTDPIEVLFAIEQYFGASLVEIAKFYKDNHPRS